MVGHSLTFCGVRNGGLGHGWERVKRDVGLKVNVNGNVNINVNDKVYVNVLYMLC